MMKCKLCKDSKVHFGYPCICQGYLPDVHSPMLAPLTVKAEKWLTLTKTRRESEDYTAAWGIVSWMAIQLDSATEIISGLLAEIEAYKAKVE